eukprot:jgi/Botrbrau1/10315/Bobra.0120s0028.1
MTSGLGRFAVVSLLIVTSSLLHDVIADLEVSTEAKSNFFKSHPAIDLDWATGTSKIAEVLAGACPELPTSEDQGYSFIVQNALLQSPSGQNVQQPSHKVLWSEADRDGCAMATGCNGQLTVKVCGPKKSSHALGLATASGFPRAAKMPPKVSRSLAHRNHSRPSKALPSGKLTLDGWRRRLAGPFVSTRMSSLIGADLAWDPQTCGCWQHQLCGRPNTPLALMGSVMPAHQKPPDLCTWDNGSWCVDLETAATNLGRLRHCVHGNGHRNM